MSENEKDRKDKQVIISGDTIRQSIESMIPDHFGIVALERQLEINKCLKETAKFQKKTIPGIPDYSLSLCKFAFKFNNIIVLITAYEYPNCFITKNIRTISKEEYDEF